MTTHKTLTRFVTVMLVLACLLAPVHAQPAASAPDVGITTVLHQRMKIGEVDLFHREAGDPKAPTVLLHGFPTSSVMFRNLIQVLATKYHVLAPDLPGFGLTVAPPRGKYQYTFKNQADAVEAFLAAKGVTSFAMYVMDYGASVGWRLALAKPAQVKALVIQNGNAHDAGLLAAAAESPERDGRLGWRNLRSAVRDALRRVAPAVGATAHARRWRAGKASPGVWLRGAGLPDTRPGRGLGRRAGAGVA